VCTCVTYSTPKTGLAASVKRGNDLRRLNHRVVTLTKFAYLVCTGGTFYTAKTGTAAKRLTSYRR
jgi:hypothetical protein